MSVSLDVHVISMWRRGGTLSLWELFFGVEIFYMFKGHSIVFFFSSSSFFQQLSSFYCMNEDRILESIKQNV